MKIEFKKIRLAVISFGCGFIFCAILLGSRSANQVVSPVSTGPVLAASQFQVLPQTKFELRNGAGTTVSEPIFRDTGITVPSADFNEVNYYRSINKSSGQHLIDQRYQPNIDLHNIR